jgi:hypothetical protein
MDFHDLNHACPKDNFPTPFIDQIINDCAEHEALSFMDSFSGYNQIQIHPSDQYKTAFTTPWGTFAYHVMPFGLKNTRATFQRSMTYIFMIWLKSFFSTWTISPLDPRNALSNLTNISFTSPQMILSMVISSSTFEHRSSATTSHGMIIDVFATKPISTSLSVISYIDEGSTPYFINV